MSTMFTPNLNIRRVQDTDQFADEAFNKSIDDIDKKVVGIAHLESPGHWTVWEKSKDYDEGDVVRYPSLKSMQYAKYTVAGTSGTTEPTADITGSTVIDGTAEFVILELGDSASSGGITLWLAGATFLRGQVAIYGTALYRCHTKHKASITFDLDESLWTEIYSSIRLWKPNVYYYIDDTAIVEDLIYQCTVSHVSDTTFTSTEESKWRLIGGGGLIKTWAVGAKYKAGQIVRYGDVYYVCKKDHTSTDFQTDGQFTHFDATYLQYPVWTSSTLYAKDIRVKYANRIWQHKLNDTSGVVWNSTERDSWEPVSPEAQIRTWDVTNDWVEKDDYCTNEGLLYKCIKSHVPSALFSSDIDKWEMVGGVGGAVEWSTDETYKENQLVTYNSMLLRANQDHISDSVEFDPDEDKWDVIYASIPLWETGVFYKEGIVVIYKNDFYRCNTSHLSSVFNTDVLNWTLLSENMAAIPDWKKDTYYYENQVIAYNNIIYRCTSSHLSLGTFALDSVDWELFDAQLEMWSPSSYYHLGIFVVQEGIIYRCVSAHTASGTFETDRAKWQIIAYTRAKLENWQANTYYYKDSLIYNNFIIYRVKTSFLSGATFADTNLEEVIRCRIFDWEKEMNYNQFDVVTKDTYLYRCIKTHTSGTLFDSTEAENWEIIGGSTGIKDWEKDTDYFIGNVVVYNNNLYRCTVDHKSSSNFILDSFNWELLGLGSASGGTNYKQINKYSITAPKNVDAFIDTTTTFMLPPVEILKFTKNTDIVSTTQFTFDIGDGSSFEINGVDGDQSEDVLFDGKAHLSTSHNIKMGSPSLLGSDYLRESAIIGNYHTIYNYSVTGADKVLYIDTDTDNTYFMSGGVFTNTTQAWSTLSDTSKIALFTSADTTLASVSDIQTISKLKIATISSSITSPIFTIEATLGNRLVLPKKVFGLEFDKIKTMIPSVTELGMGQVRFVVTKDLASYYTWDGTSFVSVTSIDASTILSQGMSSVVLSALSTTEWNTFFDSTKGIGIGFAISQNSLTDVAEVDNLALMVEMKGYWKHAQNESDFTYGYITNNILRVSLLNDGTYKINYCDNSSSGTTPDMSKYALKTEAKAYAIIL